MKRLSDIQNLPVQTRMNIMWALTLIIGTGLLGLWIYTTTQNVKNIGTIDLNGNPVPPPVTGSQQAAPRYTSVEWVERTQNKLLIYFKLTNDTDSILNFSNPSEIKLTINGEEQTAKSVTDRQGNPFVTKALSKSQSFGIAEFENKDGNTAQLKFDDLLFENSASQTFYEQLDLDLNKLTKNSN